MITYDLAHEYFEYKDGFLYWKKDKKTVKKGAKAGTLHSTKLGYIQIAFNKKYYLMHRIIFLMHHGYLPAFVDHIDGNPSNNKIENLRQASHAQNRLNNNMYSTNTSGVKNVCWHKVVKKWWVQIRVNKKTKGFGFYDDLELAELVAIEARNKHYGNFSSKTNVYVPSVTYPFKEQ